MRTSADLIDQFTDLVLRGNEPRRLAEQTLGIVLTLTHGRCAALFRVEEGRLLLFASRGLDQAALDAARAEWAAHHADLARGGSLYRPAVEDEAARARVTVPVRVEEGLAGLLYVDSAAPHSIDEDARRRLSKFTPLLARALSAPPAPAGGRPRSVARGLDRTAADGLERERLLMLLERNEWNIARVARLTGVTRRTIYLRLALRPAPRARAQGGSSARPEMSQSHEQRASALR